MAVGIYHYIVLYQPQIYRRCAYMNRILNDNRFVSTNCMTECIRTEFSNNKNRWHALNFLKLCHLLYRAHKTLTAAIRWKLGEIKIAFIPNHPYIFYSNIFLLQFLHKRYNSFSSKSKKMFFVQPIGK